MKKRHLLKKMAALVLGAAILMNSNNLISATGLEEAEKEKESLKSELAEAEKLISKLKDSKEDIQYKVTELDTKLTEISTKISELSVQLEEKDAEIVDTTDKLAKAEEEEAKQYENMKQRIRFMYEASLSSSYVAAFFSSASFSDFLNEVEYISRLEKYDREMLENYAKAKETVSDTKTTLESEKEELVAMQSEVNDSKDALTLLLSEKKNELEKIDENLEVAELSADQVQAEIDAQEELIEQIRAAEAAKQARIAAEKEKKRKEKEASEKAASEAAAASSESTENSDATENSETTGEADSENSESSDADDEDEEETYDGGAFLWPCPSSTRVTSDYGSRISPTAGASSNHKGIDIGAAYGADIVAAADDDVVASTYSSSCGNYVMIDHGGGVYTVYM
ncbi:MAG: peptidoglycan DD-metalloendopeptidase family protein, partial [Lachnospiraceae bacterium]|nr:peptidoglycan DD-metalloendopeptidase family protein [Lachnospiraceae bacterium]